MAKTSIHVVAAVIRDDTQRVLVSQRPAGKSLAGAWEFPGGKLQPGEQRLDGLARELDEELGINLEAARPLIRYRHRYPDFEVDLDAWLVTSWQGTPRGLEGQSIGWQMLDALPGIGLLSADEPMVRAVRLPCMVAITPTAAACDEDSLRDAIESVQAELICLRRTGLDGHALVELAASMASMVERTGSALVLHGDPAELAPLIMEPPLSLPARLGNVIAGLHIPARHLSSLSARPLPMPYWVGVSCHGAEELEAALKMGADYAFLGPVKLTTSHPGQEGMGWEKFASLIADLPLPVYAIGGLGPEDLGEAWAHGAQGIAAIRSLWPGSAGRRL